MKQSARSSVEILVNIGARNTKGSSAYLKSMWISRWRTWRAGIKVAIRSLLASMTLRPLGGLNFSVLLKEAAIQYIKSEKNNTTNENDDSVQSRDADLRKMNSMDTFLRRMNSTINQWRTYLASLNSDILVMSNAEVDEFVAMIEHAQKIHREGEIDDTPTHKWKQEEEETDSNHLPTF
jgi:hypothetical protein